MKVLNDYFDIDRFNNISLCGMNSESFDIFLNNLSIKSKKNILVITSSLYEANKIYAGLSNYTDKVALFPMDDFLTSEALAVSPDLLTNRLETLKDISLNKINIVITNLMGYLRYLPTLNTYKENIINIKQGDVIDPRKLYEKLVSIGYKNEAIVTKTGEVGLRGFVIDFFPLGLDNPCRIEFFGDEIESIRLFDPFTQKSIESIDGITIYPYSEFLIEKGEIESLENKQKYLPKFNKKVGNIYEYLEDAISIFVNYNQIEVSFKGILEEELNYRNTKDTDFDDDYMFDLYELKTNNTIYYNSLDNISTKDLKKIDFNVKTIDYLGENSDIINKYVSKQLENGKTVVFSMKNKLLRNIGKILKVNYHETTFDQIKENKVNFVEFDMSEGFIYNNVVFISKNEVLSNKNESKKYKTNFKYASKIKDINKLVPGDFVVHAIHGIGIYNGIKKITFDSLEKDYIEVLYKDKDKIYIPVEKIDNLSKFVGKEGIVPKINKLGGTEWQKTKYRVNKRVCDLADELIKLYAERENRRGFAFSKDTDLQKEFEKDFPYNLTVDQITVINQIKSDMESIQPMDRLLCGDVGFGKTEVAFVAAFKAIMDSKQVLLLCPTTILSNQHFTSAIERFKNFPVSIGLLNRFTSSKEEKRIIEGLKNGTIDMVIGTHRLLSDDIKPYDLGLLIIDEEQRFGVKHKEKIKQYKTNVDVLTLTATPIPRTLQMSMTGIRSLSLIETPPVDRYPVQTYVIEENDQIIKDAVYKELSRDGQVFILYNKVEDIELKMLKLSRLIPDAKINYAHGQMTKTELENRMIGFINKEFDVLLCTTIIETGIDIPNVNTLIILDADRFGLSQLYQIRGRVGRSNKFAYAYLMYQPMKRLTEQAVKRLNVIKEFTELGSGFSIATRDLSIRGAGDILGSEQAGFIDSVGIDLYMKMLNNEVLRRRGEYVEELSDDDIKPYINVSTHIKDTYVANEDLKIEIHRKINTISSRDTYNNVKNELEDRFGKLDDDMLIYMHEEWFEKLAHQLNIINVRQTRNYIEMIFDKTIINYISLDDLFVKSFSITPMFRFNKRGENLVIILDTIKLDKHPVFYLVDLLLLITENKS